MNDGMNSPALPGTPAPRTCDRCGAPLDRDTVVAYLGDIRIHAHPDECVLHFRALIAALEAENAALKQQLDRHARLAVRTFME